MDSLSYLGWICAGSALGAIGIGWLRDRARNRAQLIHSSIHNLGVRLEAMATRVTKLEQAEKFSGGAEMRTLDVRVTELAELFKRLQGRFYATRRYDKPEPPPAPPSDPAALKNHLRMKAGIIPSGANHDETEKH